MEKLARDPDGVLALQVFFVYLKAVAKVSEADVQASLKELIESRLDPEIMAVYKKWEAAEKKGEKKGKLEGKREGERSVLQRLLTQRFGALTPAAIARLEAATLTQLEAMSLRVLTAASVEEVLG